MANVAFNVQCDIRDTGSGQRSVGSLKVDKKYLTNRTQLLYLSSIKRCIVCNANETMLEEDSGMTRVVRSELNVLHYRSPILQYIALSLTLEVSVECRND